MNAGYGPEPGARPPAPGRLQLVQQFINSRDLEADTEEFQTPAQLSAWLVSHGLEKPRRQPLTSKDLELARRFRELLRELAGANNGIQTRPTLLKELNHELAIRPLTGVLQRADFARMQPTGKGIDRALGAIGAVVIEEMISGRWGRMKACAEDICRWVFYDHSRSHTGIWCTMAVCGSRAKSRAYYRRRTVR